MAQVEFNLVSLRGKRVRRYVFDYIYSNGRIRVYHLYVNLKENIFRLDYCSNKAKAKWRTELDMSYKPKQWLDSLGWSLSLFDSVDAIEEFLDCVANSIIENNKRCSYGLKVSSKFDERCELNKII